MRLSGFIPVNGDFTVSWKAVKSGAYMRISTFDSSQNFISRIASQNTFAKSSVTFNHSGYIRINYDYGYDLSEIQVVDGDNALPYVEYGIAIPVSCRNETGGIPVVIVTTDNAGAERPSGIERTIGTTSEQAFDVFSVDVTERKVYATRIGAGSDRVYEF